MKAHAFGDLQTFNLEPYVTLHALPPHWGAMQFPSMKPEFSLSAWRRDHPIFGSSPPSSDTQLTPHQAGPHPWVAPRDTLEMGCPAQGQTPAPQKLGRACGRPVLTTPPSPGSLQLDFHPLRSTATPLPTGTSDHVITKPKTFLAFLCPKFLLHVWQPGGSYLLKIALPSLMALSARISSFCDHSFVKSSSSSYP